MIHGLNVETNLQRYVQKKDEMIYSVSRAQLNMDLLTLAEETGRVKIHFDHKLESSHLYLHAFPF